MITVKEESQVRMEYPLFISEVWEVGFEQLSCLLITDGKGKSLGGSVMVCGGITSESRTCLL